MYETKIRTIAEALADAEQYEAGSYDVAVVGAGHAGCEAAAAATRLGCKTILFGMNLDQLANMPCNPNIGGTAKGQLVKEIDALGGLMGQIADEATLQFRMLNRSKGPAVLSPRAQIDRRKYAALMKDTLEGLAGLDLRQDEVVELLTDEQGHLAGLRTRFGGIYKSKRIVLTTGTYLRSRIIIGKTTFASGPDNLFPATELSNSLLAYGIALQRFKTGTPVRVNLRSIDTTVLEVQNGEEDALPFSFMNEDSDSYLNRPQLPCYLTWTNAQTHRIIEQNLDRSPLFSGIIEGVGARYCPSIEDKVVRFADKDRHQVFIEPMGEHSYEMYLQGLSTSMPQDVQLSVLHSIKGLEAAKIQRTAYAIEYDCLEPTELSASLQLKQVGGLFAAGQINGTSGYEEAAAQGLIAGINAVRSLQGQSALVLGRDQAYIGVLIDDLVTKGTLEPYRMMTSRAEFRLLLRQDNADLRLTPIGRELGLIDDERWLKFTGKRQAISSELQRLRETRVGISEASSALLESFGTSPLQGGVSLAELIRRPQLDYDKLAALDPDRPSLSAAVRYEVNVELKYEGYIQLDLQRIAKQAQLEKRLIPADFDYTALNGLRNEAKEKLRRYQPASVGQAGRISGISPADISVLLIYLQRYNQEIKHDE